MLKVQPPGEARNASRHVRRYPIAGRSRWWRRRHGFMRLTGELVVLRVHGDMRNHEIEIYSAVLMIAGCWY